MEAWPSVSLFRGNKLTNQAFFLTVQIIKNKQYGSGQPGDRIAEDDRIHCRPDLKRAQQPQDPEKAYAAQRDQCRDQHIADPAQRAGEHFYKYKEHIARRDQRHHFTADPDDVGVIRKDPEQGCAQRQEENHQHNRDQSVHPQADPDALFYPVIFAGTEVLAHKGGDGNPDCSADHPEHRVQLSIYRPCRNRIRSEIVQRGLDEDIGKAVHDGLKSGGHTDTQQRSQYICVEPELSQGQPEDAAGYHQLSRHQHRAGSL